MSLGIGMDASVTPLRHGGLSLVQTTDFFYPLVDDPYMMGKFKVQFIFLINIHFELVDELNNPEIIIF